MKRSVCKHEKMENIYMWNRVKMKSVKIRENKICKNATFENICKEIIFVLLIYFQFKIKRICKLFFLMPYTRFSTPSYWLFSFKGILLTNQLIYLSEIETNQLTSRYPLRKEAVVWIDCTFRIMIYVFDKEKMLVFAGKK